MRADLRRPIAGRRGCRHRRSQDAVGGPKFAAPDERLAEHPQRHGTAGVVLCEEIDPAAEEADSGRNVGAVVRGASCGEQPLGGRAGERALRLTVEAQLCAEAKRLLEVVRDDLVQLERRPRRPFDPLGEASVEVSAKLLRQGGVRRVADQQMAEPKRVLARLRPDQLLAHQVRQEPIDVAANLFGRQLCDGPRVEHLPLDRPPGRGRAAHRPGGR